MSKEQLPEHKTTPEMAKFFENLTKIKTHVRRLAKETKDPRFQEIYDMIHATFKVEGEEHA